MDKKLAIENRISRRTYTGNPIDSVIKEKLESAIWECNRLGNLHIKLVEGSDPFENFQQSYGMFKRVTNYMVMIGEISDPDMEEKIGYFGESLILYLTDLGLGTCWVTGTYDKENIPCQVEEDEEIKALIVLGETKEKTSIKEKLISAISHHKDGKEAMDFFPHNREEEIPPWVWNGIEMVEHAPSAVNRQPVYFTYEDGNILAHVGEKKEEIDLGIAKLHFEIGVSDGSWEFGNGGRFNYENITD